MALIGYYFGSKEGLFTQAYRLNAEPINRERRKRLSDLLAAETHPTLAAVLEAWIAPVFTDHAQGKRHLFIRLMAFLSEEKLPFAEDLVFETHGDVNSAFLDALQACPAEPFA